MEMDSEKTIKIKALSMSPLIQFCIILITSFVISPLILRGISLLLSKWQLLDRPHLYRTEKGREPAPYGAGITIIITLLVLSPLVFLFA